MRLTESLSRNAVVNSPQRGVRNRRYTNHNERCAIHSDGGNGPRFSFTGWRMKDHSLPCMNTLKGNHFAFDN